MVKLAMRDSFLNERSDLLWWKGWIKSIFTSIASSTLRTLPFYRYRLICTIHSIEFLLKMSASRQFQWFLFIFFSLFHSYNIFIVFIFICLDRAYILISLYRSCIFCYTWLYAQQFSSFFAVTCYSIYCSFLGIGSWF